MLRTAEEQSRSCRALGLEVLQTESTGRTSDEVATGVARAAQGKPVEAYRAREARWSSPTGEPTWLTAAAHSAFLVAFLVVPAPTERSLGNPAGKLVRHRSGPVEGLVTDAPGGIDALCLREVKYLPDIFEGR